MERVKEETAFSQSEGVSVASISPIKLQTLPKMNFDGTNRGLSWFPIPLPSWDDASRAVDKVTFDAIFKNVIAQDGAGDGKPGPTYKKKLVFPGGDVLVFPFARHLKEDQEYIHSYQLHWVAEFFTAYGDMALASLEADIQYVGFCNNKAHKRYVMMRLDKYVFDNLARPGHRFYRESFAQAMQGIIAKHRGVADATPSRGSVDHNEGAVGDGQEGAQEEEDENDEEEESEEEEEEEEEDEDEEEEEESDEASPLLFLLSLLFLMFLMFFWFLLSFLLF